ncbi:MAG: Holliday junction resolvase RuvX [Bacteroidales bacterium]|nr:Holliday junction resolvase RuvX [Bacteroidales bacterium]
MGRILCIDYGRKRVGIAVSDPLRIIANALTTVHAKDIFTFLDNYLHNEVVDIIVVGYPKRTNNQESEAMQYIRPFFNKLRSRYSTIECVLFDERFSSKIAIRSMIEGGMKQKDRQNKEIIDKVSATIILQDYLNYLKYHSS